jgi:outer membrane receptor protein involved in Fe transport
VSSTISVFKQELTNQAVFGGNLPNGITYQLPIGSTKQEGVDADVSVSLAQGLEFIVTGYKGKVTDQTGTQVSGTYRSSVSVFTRYDFGNQGPLKGLAVGAGFVTVGGRTVATGGATGIFNIPGGVPPFIKVDGGHLVNVFAHYELGKQWSFRGNVNNVLDDHYPLGLQGPIAVDPSPPRTVSFSASYRF